MLKDGDLVLMDSGCQYHGYCSDQSRTFPVNGKFTEPQAEIYSLVLRANEECIRQSKVGKSLFELHHLSKEILADGLRTLKILPDDPIKAAMGLRQFYPHSIGHWLGIDVHDCHSVPSNTPLRPNMAITIEPGLYLPVHSGVPDKYKGIGIRIEDNVVITQVTPSQSFF